VTTLKVLNWNIGNPSAERATKQLEAIAAQGADLLCLTETKASTGCQLLKARLETQGYAVHALTPPPGEYGTLLASRHGLSDLGTIGPIGQEARAPKARLPDGTLVIGMYAPSNATTPEKLERKSSFIRHIATELASLRDDCIILLGDFNTVSSNHVPPAPFLTSEQTRFVDDLLANWDDALVADTGPTWTGWRGDAYRYDYCLTRGLTASAGTRIEQLRRPGLSDHLGTSFEYSAPHLTAPQPQWRFH
jgi:exonuclease III